MKRIGERFFVLALMAALMVSVCGCGGSGRGNAWDGGAGDGGTEQGSSLGGGWGTG